jgi:hypothetical protein
MKVAKSQLWRCSGVIVMGMFPQRGERETSAIRTRVASAS